MINQKRKKQIINSLPLLMFCVCINSCSIFNQKDFIVSKIISNQPEEQVFYDVYQTGIDNYIFEFKATSNKDTSKLFTHYINDAVYTVMKFDISTAEDTLIIRTNFPPKNKINGKTKQGTIVILMDQ